MCAEITARQKFESGTSITLGLCTDSLQFGGENQECFNLLLIFYFGTFYLVGILWYLYFIYICKSKMYIVGTYMSFSSNVATGVRYVSENV